MEDDFYGEVKVKIEECKHGYLYRINSRNLSHGVYDKSQKGFIGIRSKFGHHYLFSEYHWDTGAPFGTVKPQEEIEKCPVPLSMEKKLFEYLEKFSTNTRRRAKDE